MCGIAGIIYKQDSPNNSGAIEKMTGVVAHRGPDGCGYWKNNRVDFGHRRLAIIDLSEGGAQPMEYNGYVITYNGEIYNYPEIRQALIKLGYSFRSQCDTEVVLAAYQCWGAKCQERFNGMWAFAIYDPYKNIVFCSRDRFGIKPFYYLNINDKLVFGSEIKQLLPFLYEVKANSRLLTHYLAFSLLDYSDNSFFESVKNLPGSHYLVYNLHTNKAEVSRYYTISVHDEYNKLSYSDALSGFQTHFERSVNWRLRSDTRVGTCLSGGLDSSLIALTARGNYKGSNAFSAFTAASTTELENDAPFAKMVAETLALDWHLTTPTAADFCNDLERVCAVMEEPVVSPTVFMQHYVMRAASQQGLKVLLDGQGSDETLLGYQRYIGAMAWQLSGMERFRFLMQARSHYGITKSQLLPIYLYFSNWQLRKKYTFFKLRGMRSKYFDLIDDDFMQQLSHAYKDPLALQKLEITATQIPALLRYEDRNSMHYSIETRLPFLDWQLLEFNLSLPAAFKIKNGWSKYPIRDTMNNRLPDAITWRKNKLGFKAPEKTWLNTSTYHFRSKIAGSAILNQMFKNPLALAKVENGMFWKMLNIACWEEIYNVKG